MIPCAEASERSFIDKYAQTRIKAFIKDTSTVACYCVG